MPAPPAIGRRESMAPGEWPWPEAVHLPGDFDARAGDCESAAAFAAMRAGDRTGEDGCADAAVLFSRGESVAIDSGMGAVELEGDRR